MKLSRSGATIVLICALSYAVGSGIQRFAAQTRPMSALTPARERRPLGAFQGTFVETALPYAYNKSPRRITIINYFATWCGPCRAEAASLARTAARYRLRGVDTIGVLMDEGASPVVVSAAASYRREYKIAYPFIRVPPDPLVALNGMAVPVTLLIDRQGRIAASETGAISEAGLAMRLDELLREK